jgi:hypothetical protein
VHVRAVASASSAVALAAHRGLLFYWAPLHEDPLMDLTSRQDRKEPAPRAAAVRMTPSPHGADPEADVMARDGPGRPSTATQILALQRVAGNAAVSSLFAPAPVVQRSDVQIDEVASSVRTTDTGSLLPPELIAELVKIVAAEIEKEKDPSRGSPVSDSGATEGPAGGDEDWEE